MLRFLALIFPALFLASQVAAQAGYKVRSGDTLQIEVLQDSNLNRSVLVLPDGSINYLGAGTFRARGRTVGQIEDIITQRIGTDFASEPDVFVSVLSVFVPPQKPPVPVVPKEDPKVGIFLMGEVNSAGAVAAKPGITILQAIASAGGLSKFAATKRIQLRRSDSEGVERIYRYNYDNPRAENSLPGNFRLQEGDVIVVPARKLFE